VVIFHLPEKECAKIVHLEDKVIILLFWGKGEDIPVEANRLRLLVHRYFMIS
jgi:hypothetical protein